MTRPVTVLIADDQAPIRDALADLVASEQQLESVGTAHDAEAAIQLARATQPDVALLDVKMPAGGGLRAAKVIRTVSPETRIVGLSAYDDRSIVRGMLDVGATSYLLKGASPDEIVDTILRTARGERVFSPGVQAVLPERDRDFPK